MSKIFLITGGVKSGKTRCAIKYFEECDNVVYIPTLDNISIGTELEIAESRVLRPKTWITREECYSPARAISDEKLFILDSVTYLVINHLREAAPECTEITKKIREEVSDNLMSEVREFIRVIRKLNCDAIITTNEIGFSTMPTNAFELAFRDILAKANSYICQQSDELYLSLCGTQLRIF